VVTVPDRASLIRSLAAAGCVAPDDEADELLACGMADAELTAMVRRRLAGEPLAWIVGRVGFCGLDIFVDPGVYVPRWQSEALVRRAAELLPDDGVAVDLATGAGAIARVLHAARPGAVVVGTELDPVAADCARRNGVTVFEGDLDEALPEQLAAEVDVIVGVLPYVPHDALHLLPRDVREHEPHQALDGGRGGLELVSRAVLCADRWLRPDGWLLLEVGSDQIDAVTNLFGAAGFTDLDVVEDGDGDPRGVVGRWAPR
jgi:release factor glutamine methyltransferase